MATFTAITFNLFEPIGLVQPCIPVMVREPMECTFERQPLRMRWVHEVDSNGRGILRIQWTADNQSEGKTPSAHRSN